MRIIKIIFLDCDGVINTGEKYSNGYNKIDPLLVDRLNIILNEVPDAQIVLISAWRYMAPGNNELIGKQVLENLLLSHGVDCYNRFFGYTCSDEQMAEIMGLPQVTFESLEKWYAWIKEHGIRIRNRQIKLYLSLYPEITNHVVIDNMDLNYPGQIIVDDRFGLSDNDVNKAICILKKDEL